MNTKLTDLQFAVCRAIDESEYGCDLTDDVWTFSMSGHLPDTILPRQISGIVSILVQRQLVRVGGSGNEAYIGLTMAGAGIYLLACQARGVTPQKEV